MGAICFASLVVITADDAMEKLGIGSGVSVLLPHFISSLISRHSELIIKRMINKMELALHDILLVPYYMYHQMEE